MAEENIEKKLEDIHISITNLNNENNLHKIIKKKKNIEDDIILVEKQIKKLKKNNSVYDDSDSEECSDSSENTGQTNESEEVINHNFKYIEKKYNSLKNIDKPISEKIKIKNDLVKKINESIKYLKKKKLTVIEK